MPAPRVYSLSGAPAAAIVWHRALATGQGAAISIASLACRVTFVLRDGVLPLAATQEPVWQREAPYPDGASRAVWSPRDLVPLKPRVDVLLVGRAFAPRGQPTRSLTFRVHVGEVDKRVHVSAEDPFESMPLVHERAAMTAGNPLGIDARQGSANLVSTAPNAAAALGPIAEAWEPRARLARDAGFAPAATFDGAAIPQALDPAFFQAAPADQQLAALRGDETITLEAVHPDHAVLAARLPGIAPIAFTDDGRSVAMRADTLWIDTGRSLVSLTFRGQLRLAGPPVAEMLVMLAPLGTDIGWDAVKRVRAGAPAPIRVPSELEDPTDRTIAGGVAFRSLPFAAVTIPGQPDAPAARANVGLPFATAGGPAPVIVPAVTVDVDSTLELSGAPLVRASPESAPPAAGALGSPPVRRWHTGPPPIDAYVGHESAAVAEAIPPPDVNRGASNEVIRLIGWCDDAARAAREDPELAHIVDALRGRPLDAELDAPDRGELIEDLEAWREVYEVLAAGACGRLVDAVARLSRTVESGVVRPPVALLAGELTPTSDAIASLREALAATVSQGALSAEAKAVVERGKLFLSLPSGRPTAEIAAGIERRLRAIIDPSVREEIDRRQRRALVERRCVVEHVVFGGPHARGTFVQRDGSAVSLYTPRAIAEKLPLAAKQQVRVLARVHPVIDASPDADPLPVTLRALALATVEARQRGGRG